MADLRLILIAAGLLFLGLLAWLGGRRPRRARDEPERPRGFADGALRGFAEGGQGPEHTLGEAAVSTQPQAPAQSSSPSGAAPEPRETSLRRDPPVIEWAEAITQPRGEPGLSSFEDMPVMQGGPSFGSSALASPAVAATASARPVVEHHFDDPTATVSAVRIVADANGLPPPPALVVDWPPEPERYIASLRVVPERGEQVGGRALRQALAACGFRHGPFGIFHLAQEDGRVLISAASLVRPGLLDPASMDFQHFPGLNLFAVLPAPVEPAAVLERLCRAALDLAARIGGSVQDESGATLDHPHTQDWRAHCIASFAQREPPPAAVHP
jgi:FtsZ-interacting cell division protein ZipA